MNISFKLSFERWDCQSLNSCSSMFYVVWYSFYTVFFCNMCRWLGVIGLDRLSSLLSHPHIPSHVCCYLVNFVNVLLMCHCLVESVQRRLGRSKPPWVSISPQKEGRMLAWSGILWYSMFCFRSSLAMTKSGNNASKWAKGKEVVPNKFDALLSTCH